MTMMANITKEGLVLIVILTILATAADLRTRRIPNGIILTGLLTGLVDHIRQQGMEGMIPFLIGMMIPLLLLWILFYFRMFGAGDLKLLIMLGGAFGPSSILRIFFYSILTGGVISIILMIQRRNLLSRLHYFMNYSKDYIKTGQWKPYINKEDRDSTFPFSVSVLVGLICYLGGELIY